MVCTMGQEGADVQGTFFDASGPRAAWNEGISLASRPFVELAHRVRAAHLHTALGNMSDGPCSNDD